MGGDDDSHIPEALSLHARAASALLQAYSSSAQVEAATAQVVDLDWNGGKSKIHIAYHLGNRESPSCHTK